MRSVCFFAIAATLIHQPALADDGGFRILVFAPQAPVIVRIHVEFDAGVTLEAQRKTYAARWFARLDADEDRQLSPTEARHVPSFGRFEGIVGEMQEEWPRLDLPSADGILSFAELHQHVVAAMGPGLSVKRPNRPRRSASQSVILHPRLDRDRDGQVSQEELVAGSDSLEPFDFDDDGTFSAAELQPFPSTMRVVAMIAEDGAPPFVVLDESADLRSNAGRLIAQYGDDAGVPPAILGLTDLQAKTFDRNHDQSLNLEEVSSALLDLPDHLVLHARFPTRRTMRLETGGQTDSRVVVIDEESTRRVLMVQLGGMKVDAKLLDATGSLNSITERFRAAQFGIADRDRDDALSKEEFGRLEIENITFTAVDADRDDRVSKEEYDDFVGLRALLGQCRLEMTVENETTSLFEALDINEDYRISPREFEQGAGPLESLDRNGNGKLAESELVTKYTLSFALTRPPEFDDLVGSAGFNQMNETTLLPIVRPVTSGPPWFRKMDRNQDGDVTWREFLGPRASFEQFDADRNGLIDSSEAAGS